MFCEICFWTLIEIFCFYTMFITFVRWLLSVGIKRFTYLLTYLLTSLHTLNTAYTLKLVSAVKDRQQIAAYFLSLQASLGGML